MSQEPKPRPTILLIIAMCVTSGLLYGYNLGVVPAALWETCLLSTLTFPMLLKSAGDSGAFLIYAGIGTVAWLFILVLTPKRKVIPSKRSNPSGALKRNRHPLGLNPLNAPE